ncbi:MAG: putative metal-binding motif-containing protein [Pseudomonadota bacterium]|nr:putative metal-binding motif-containing protein [Pseudomonadota bacterium]
MSILLLLSAAHAGVIALESASPSGPGNSIPFGGVSADCNVSDDYQGFVYKNVPAFDLLPGDTLAFDLGAENDATIELDIALAAAVSNGSLEQEASGFTDVVTGGVPSDPDGNDIEGDFELVFTVEAPFSFAGGGLLIRFHSAGSYAEDTTCTQVLMYASGYDGSSLFVERFYNDEDGVYPWGSGGYNHSTDIVAQVRITFDEGTPWYRDADGDGYGDPTDSLVSESAPDGYVVDATDCDDTDATVSPADLEYCDGVGIDDDCDGVADEDSALDAETFYADDDGDGYGDAAATHEACAAPSGYVENDTDCDDGEPLAHPGATEVCDGFDNDCDGHEDEDDAADAGTWYSDNDADGYGVTTLSRVACEAPEGFAGAPDDCDDARAATFPGADEYCNGYDDNCDGDIDEGESLDALPWYADADGDTWGAPGALVYACSLPAGYVADATDCDDASAAVFPGAIELCNAVDDDCDGRRDESDAADAPTWYADVDGDTWGDAGASQPSCAEPDGYVVDSGDCDDRDANRNPAEDEVWYDGVDQDCDGNDDDQDADGSPFAADCDDEDAERAPGNEEVWYDDVDQDCLGDSDFDMDGDGQDSETYGGEDCDDADDTIYTGAVDDPYDGVVTDCSSAGEYDGDADGYASDGFDGDDCDDANSDIHPGAEDTPDDGVDQDCDGADASVEDVKTAGECGCGGGEGAWLLMGLPLGLAWRRRRGHLSTSDQA